MAYLDQFSIQFGVATSVTRNIQSHTSGRISGSTSPAIVNGTSYGGGSSGGGTITTTHRNMEQGIIVTESGAEHPYSIEIDDPFLRDGSLCALTMRNGKPVVITNVASGWRGWINGGPEAGAPGNRGVKRWLILAFIIGGIATLVLQFMSRYDVTIWNYVPFVVSALLVFISLKNSNTNAANEVDRLEKQKQRTELVDNAIAKYKAENAISATGT